MTKRRSELKGLRAPAPPQNQRITAAARRTSNRTRGVGKHFLPEQGLITPGLQTPQIPRLPETMSSGKTMTKNIETPTRQLQASGPTFYRSLGRAALAISWDEYGLFVPPDADVLVVDGVAAPPAALEVSAGHRRLFVCLSPGKHVVRFKRRGKARSVSISTPFLEAYERAATAVSTGNRWDFELLVRQSIACFEKFDSPVIPHFWGNYYWQQGNPAAARRHYLWALDIWPNFAPSLFNLGILAKKEGREREANQLLSLARLWNWQDAYGLARPLCEHPPSEPLPDAFASLNQILKPWTTALTDEDRDVVTILKTSAAFVPDEREAVKLVNNIGAYFEHVGKYDLALAYYRKALSQSVEGKEETRELVLPILRNLARATGKGNMPEAGRYARMVELLSE